MSFGKGFQTLPSGRTVYFYDGGVIRERGLKAIRQAALTFDWPELRRVQSRLQLPGRVIEMVVADIAKMMGLVED